MKNESIAWLATILVIGLVVGGLFTYAVFPREVTITKDVVKEVVKEVVVEKNVTITAPSDLDRAVATFMQAVEDEEDESGEEVNVQEGYDFSDISISKVSDEYTLTYDKDTVTVEFEIKLKYDEKGDSERYEKIDYNVVVVYEEDEDSTVTATEI